MSNMQTKTIKGTWHIIITVFIFIFNKLLKQGAVKEEKTFRKFDCNK